MHLHGEGYLVLKGVIGDELLQQLLQLCQQPRQWKVGINNSRLGNKNDDRRLFSAMTEDEKQSCNIPMIQSRLLHNLGLGTLLTRTTPVDPTFIKQLKFCGQQLCHTDYDSEEPGLFDGFSVPFGTLIALTSRSTWIAPKSHKLKNQPRITVDQEPGDLLFLLGNVRHGGYKSGDMETFGIHTYWDVGSYGGGVHPVNAVCIPPWE